MNKHNPKPIKHIPYENTEIKQVSHLLAYLKIDINELDHEKIYSITDPRALMIYICHLYEPILIGSTPEEIGQIEMLGAILDRFNTAPYEE